jgi:K+-sensing histidine kinase KdpD
MEVAEHAYTCVSSIIPADLFLIHHKTKGQEANLFFIRTINDSTITGRVMRQERKISSELMAGTTSKHKAVLPLSPPLHYSGTSCTIGNVTCCLSLLRVTGEFTDQEQGFSSIVNQIIISSFLNKIIEDKSQKIGTQELQSQRQNNFISNITHDLRNPLGCIKGYSSTLLRDDIEWDMETQKKFITVIDNEADRLGEMITNMLETARLENGAYELNFDQVAVSALLNTLIEGNKDKHPGLAIIVDAPSQDTLFMVDTQKIIRAFQNLVDNTVKHTNTLEIWIKIELSQNTIHFYFIDKGKGIPHTRWKSVFNKFSRNPNDSPGTHGSGLGLYITKQIISKHGGEIEIDEATNEGTVIHITLPKIPSTTDIA